MSRRSSSGGTHHIGTHAGALGRPSRRMQENGHAYDADSTSADGRYVRFRDGRRLKLALFEDVHPVFSPSGDTIGWRLDRRGPSLFFRTQAEALVQAGYDHQQRASGQPTRRKEAP